MIDCLSVVWNIFGGGRHIKLENDNCDSIQIDFLYDFNLK